MFILQDAAGETITTIGNPMEDADGLMGAFRSRGAARAYTMSSADEAAMSALIFPAPEAPTEQNPEPTPPAHGSYQLVKDKIVAKDSSGKTVATYPAVVIDLTENDNS